MKKCLPNLKFLTVAFAMMLMVSVANAATYFSRASGQWNNINTWSLSSGGASAGVIPGSGDVINIENNFNVTIPAGFNAFCTTLNVTVTGSAGNSGTLTFASTATLTVSGNVTVGTAGSNSREGTIDMTAGGTLTCNGNLTIGNDGTSAPVASEINQGSGSVITVGGNATILDPGNGGFANQWLVNAGTATVTGTFTMNNTGGGTEDCNFSISTGTATLTGAVTMNGAATENSISITGAGTLNLGSSISLTNGTFNPGTANSIVNYNGAAQTIRGATYENLTLTGSNTKSVGVDFTVSNDLNIGTGITLQATAASDLTLDGNLINAGTMNFDNAVNDINTIFNGAANQSVSGAGTTEFSTVQINNTGAANNNIVEITATNYSFPTAGFLTLTDGILKLSGTSTITNTFFATSTYTIPAAAGLWLNNSNVTVTAQGNTITLSGLLRLTSGIYNIGTGASDGLNYSTGSVFTMEGGTFNIAGRFCGSGTTQTNNFTMSGGTLTVTTAGTNSNTFASFDISAAGSTFTMSGGTIVVEERNAGNANDYRNIASTTNITGGTVQFGNSVTPNTADNFFIGVAGNNTLPSMTIVDNATSVPSVDLVSPIIVKGNLTINAGTSLLANGIAINISGNTAAPGNWINDGTFTSGTQTVTFDGNAAQSIGGTNTTAFSSITFNNNVANTAVGITVSKLATVAATATFTKGIVSTDNTNYLSFLAGSSAGGAGLSQATDASYVSGPVRKTGSTGFTFPVGSVKVGVTGGYMPLVISAPGEAGDIFTCEYTRNSATTYPGSTGCTSPLLNVSGCDYWNLNENADPGNNNSLTVTLSWDNGSPCGSAPFITNLSGVTVAHFTNPKWDVPTGLGVTSTTGNTTTGTVSRTLVTVFSPLSIGNTNLFANPLPVLFNNVKAFERGAGVQIEWTNLTEKDVVSYSVERSVNGTNFTSIAQLGARGNISDAQSYLSFDATPSATNFYRIKVVEADGHIVYSKLMKVDIGKSPKGLILYPNPVVGNDLSIGFTAARGQYSLSVVNAAGQQVYIQKISHAGGTVSQAITLPATVKSGVYSMMITGDNYKETKMFVIQ